MKIKKPIRIYWGENYSDKPPIVEKAIKQAVEKTLDKLNLYPGDLYQNTVKVVASQLSVKPEQVLLGHGIEGLINLTYRTFMLEDKCAGMFEPSFFVFENNLKRGKQTIFPCHYKSKVDLASLIEGVKEVDLLFLASPNTATGNYLLNSREIELVLKKIKGILVVDECYFGIGDQTVIKLLQKYSNLIVYRGMTKVMGMGSARLGIALASPDLIKAMTYLHTDIELDPINSFSLNLLRETFPYYDILAKNTREFFGRFRKMMREMFKETTIIGNVTTFDFMDIRPYKIPAFEIINYMNKNGYLFSATDLTDNKSIHFPEFIELTPPPEDYWNDFVKTLKMAVSTK